MTKPLIKHNAQDDTQRTENTPSNIAEELARAQKVAWILDNAIEIPIIKRRIGVDALLGLIPVIGDIGGYLISLLAIHRAKKFGASFGTLFSMISNILVEAIIGLVPFVGDIFDMAWKSNTRNVKLLEAHLNDLQEKPKRGFSLRDGLWIGGILMLLGSMLTGAVVFWLWVFGVL